jgi:predicted RND superfamily exporter protein
MAVNETRRLCFNLNGLLGGIIATVLLLCILAFLTVWNISVQKANAEKYYSIDNPNAIQMKSVDNEKHYKIKN